MPFGAGGPGPLQQAQPSFEVVEHFLRGEAPEPGGGELERQWEPVKAAAQGVDRGGVGVEVDSGSTRLGAGAEEPDGRAAPDRLQVLGRGKGEDVEGEDVLLGQPERFPTGGEHPHAGAVCAQRAHGAGRFLEQVLAVIEDEQLRRGSQRLGCGVQGGEAQGVGDREGDDLGLGDRGELAQRDVAVPLAGGGARRSRLAHAAHPGQRHDRADLEQARHLAELGLAAMEGRSRSAQQLAGNLLRRRQGVGHRAPGRPGHRHRWHRRRRRDGLLLLEDRTLQAREPVLGSRPASSARRAR